MSLQQFRLETRDWLDRNCPQAIRGRHFGYSGGQKRAESNNDFKAWFERCVERGFTVPKWPAEYGGAGLSDAENTILTEAINAIRAPRPLMGMGVNLIGPTLLEFGTDEQKHLLLPKIARGEVRWCQGYSEPGAGSDLAGLQTRAAIEGHDYVVNGSKIWTSGAQLADWIFCLVRTDPRVPKHDGISFLLFPMDLPGIIVKRIELISGGSEFCEVFFTDVRVPVANRLGEENMGWSIAKRLLQFERYSVTVPGASGFDLTVGGLPDIARTYANAPGGRIEDSVLRDRIVNNAMGALALKLTMQRIKQESAHSDAVSVTTSIFKYCSTELTCEKMNCASSQWVARVLAGRARVSINRNWCWAAHG